MPSTSEVFAAMGAAVEGAGGKAIQRKFKVSKWILFFFFFCWNDIFDLLVCYFVETCLCQLLKIPSHHSLFVFVKGQVVFRITDTDEVYSLDLKGPVFSVEKGDKNMTSPDLTVMITSENMAALISGALKPQQAFMKGKLKIKGKMNLAMKLPTVLAATRKKLPNAKM